MKKTILAVTASLFACIGASQAAIVVVSNVSQGVGDTLFATSTNVRMNSGVVTAGYFAAGFDVNANLSNWAALVANFTVVASGTPGTGAIPSIDDAPHAGYIEGTGVAAGSITGANPLVGRMLYGFVGGSATLAQSIGSGGGGIALFEIRTLLDDVPFENTYVADPKGKVIKIGTTGTFNGDAGAGAGVYGTLQLAVPEPSVALLGALAMVGFLRRRR